MARAPHPTSRRVIPMAGHPNSRSSRTPLPMATVPNPSPLMIRPVAFDPDMLRGWRDTDDFPLNGWWFSSDNYLGRRRYRSFPYDNSSVADATATPQPGTNRRHQKQTHFPFHFVPLSSLTME